MSLNKVILIGRLGKDSELIRTPNGNPILKATIATSEKFKDKDGKSIEKTEWHRITLFNKRAEALHPYLVKGTQIYLEGKIHTSQYEKDGVKQFSTDIIVNDIIFLGSKEKTTTPQPHPDQKQFDQVLGDMSVRTMILTDNDEIPF